MMFDAMRNYTEPEARYSGTVYMNIKGRIDGPFTIKKSFFNRLTKIFMYAFEETSVCVAECYLVKHPADQPLSWSECMYDDSNIIDEILSSKNKLGGSRGINGGLSLDFFQPDEVFIKWIKEYAGNRLIIDIGCGSGKVLLWLMNEGARACGIDPFWDFEKGTEMNMNRVISGKEMIQVLNKKIEDVPELFVGKGNKVLLLFCRPCHSDFVTNVLDLKDPDTEVLYITIPENMKRYNDLGRHQKRAKLLNHKGYSVESEVVYSII